MTHGTPSAYTYWGCRCPLCRGNETRRVQALKAARPPATAVVLAHGTIGAYTNWGCRCEDCKRAKRDYGRLWRRRRTAGEAQVGP